MKYIFGNENGNGNELMKIILNVRMSRNGCVIEKI
jgi:hypothetical protein